MNTTAGQNTPIDQLCYQQHAPLVLQVSDMHHLFSKSATCTTCSPSQQHAPLVLQVSNMHHLFPKSATGTTCSPSQRHLPLVLQVEQGFCCDEMKRTNSNALKCSGVPSSEAQVVLVISGLAGSSPDLVILKYKMFPHRSVVKIQYSREPP